jgi:hypothetical protein
MLNNFKGVFMGKILERLEQFQGWETDVNVTNGPHGVEITKNIHGGKYYRVIETGRDEQGEYVKLEGREDMFGCSTINNSLPGAGLHRVSRISRIT